MENKITEKVEWRADEKYNKQIMAILDGIIEAVAKNQYETWYKGLYILSMHIIVYIERYESDKSVKEGERYEDMLETTRKRLETIAQGRRKNAKQLPKSPVNELNNLHKHMVRILAHFNVFAGLKASMDTKASEQLV